MNAPLEEERFLKGEEAQHQVRAPAQLADAPPTPGPDLRSDEVHHFDSVPLRDRAHRKIGSRRIDRNVQHRAMLEHPGIDASIHAAMLLHLLEPGHAYDRIVALSLIHI